MTALDFIFLLFISYAVLAIGALLIGSNTKDPQSKEGKGIWVYLGYVLVVVSGFLIGVGGTIQSVYNSGIKFKPEKFEVVSDTTILTKNGVSDTTVYYMIKPKKDK